MSEPADRAPRKRKAASEASPTSLVGTTAERMRDLILAHEAGVTIGELPDVAKSLGVGIVTVQQAARILEHEGLLEVRRGPGGGYFGRRPDAASLERLLAAYLRVHGSYQYEALEMMTHLDCELIPAAAGSITDGFVGDLRALADRVELCTTSEERVAFEDDFHAVVFRIVDRPLIELLAKVSMRSYRNHAVPPIFEGDEGLIAWRKWRSDVIAAILARDPERARFEAERHRRQLLQRLERNAVGPPR